MKTTVYAGVLDDVLWRPPLAKRGEADIHGRERRITELHGQSANEETLLNQTLMTAALTGVRLAVNDGYLLNLRSAREQLCDRDSPLWQLINAGQILVLSRNAHFDKERGIHTVAEEMAEEGVASFTNLLEFRSLHTGENLYETQLREPLLDANEALRKVDGYQGWPPFDLGEGFHQRMKSVISFTPASIGISESSVPFLEDAFARFDQRISDSGFGAARTKWETEVRGVTNKNSGIDNAHRYLVRRELMQLACECYHFNFASLMRKGSPPNQRIAVITRTSGAFDDLLFDEDLGDVHVDVQEDEIPIPVFDSDTTRLLFEDKTFFPKLFDQREHLNQLRKDYVYELNRYLSSGKQRELLDKAEKKLIREAMKRIGGSGIRPDINMGTGAIVAICSIAPHLLGAPQAVATLGGIAGLAACIHGGLPYLIKKRKLGRMKRAKLTEVARFDQLPIVNVSLIKERCDSLNVTSFQPQ